MIKNYGLFWINRISFKLILTGEQAIYVAFLYLRFSFDLGMFKRVWKKTSKVRSNFVVDRILLLFTGSLIMAALFYGLYLICCLRGIPII